MACLLNDYDARRIDRKTWEKNAEICFIARDNCWFWVHVNRTSENSTRHQFEWFVWVRFRNGWKASKYYANELLFWRLLYHSASCAKIDFGYCGSIARPKLSKLFGTRFIWLQFLAWYVEAHEMRCRTFIPDEYGLEAMTSNILFMISFSVCSNAASNVIVYTETENICGNIASCGVIIDVKPKVVRLH